MTVQAGDGTITRSFVDATGLAVLGGLPVLHNHRTTTVAHVANREINQMPDASETVLQYDGCIADVEDHMTDAIAANETQGRAGGARQRTLKPMPFWMSLPEVGGLDLAASHA